MKIDTSFNTMNMDLTKSASQANEVEDFGSFFDSLNESSSEEEVKAVFQEFESLFINTLFQTMRSATNLGEGFIEKSHATEMFEGMLDEEFSKVMSNTGGIGIADMMYKQYTNFQNTTEKENEGFDMKG